MAEQKPFFVIKTPDVEHKPASDDQPANEPEAVDIVETLVSIIFFFMD
jgi:hypothetical protein